MSASPGDRVRIQRSGTTYEGLVLPSSSSETIVIKLDGGYNVGIDRTAGSIDVLERDARTIDHSGEDQVDSAITYDEDLPTIALVSTGGTIASTVDYRTGAVTAQFDAEDILRAVPELRGRANYRGRVVANVLSENMEPAIWQDLATAIHEEIADGADGVVVMHGTDTMQYSAAAVSFMLDTPVPVVFTGSQRSADRPSSDNVVNAVCAVEAATADHAEVLVCMHANDTDDRCALHRGTRVRKAHTSRRDAFRTVGQPPIGSVEYDDETVSFRRDPAPRGATHLAVEPALDTNVAHIKFVPGMDEDPLKRDVEGLVIEGTGLGHIHSDLIATIDAQVDSGTTVVMTSQCIEGRVCDRVYDTGRDLLKSGVREAGDTLPGTAYVKLMWALANADKPGDMMEQSIAGELTERSTPWQ